MKINHKTLYEQTLDNKQKYKQNAKNMQNEKLQKRLQKLKK